MIQKDLTLRGKSLSTKQLKSISKATQTSNPLFARVMLNELVLTGKFETLDQQLDSMLAKQSTDDLFDLSKQKEKARKKNM